MNYSLIFGFPPILRTLLVSVMLPCFVLLFSMEVRSQEDEGWKKVRDNNGIQGYVLKLPEMEMKKVKVETVTESSLSALVALMIDAPKNTEWVYVNQYASILEKSDDFNWVYYGQSDAPWPVNDRDVISRVHMSQNPITKEVILASVGIPDFIPANEGFVRIPLLQAAWKFKPLGKGRVKVSFELLLDLGGNIPAWVVNLAVTKGPYNSLKDFIRIAHEEPYKSMQLEYIREPQW